jgi:hypothetical protein
MPSFPDSPRKGSISRQDLDHSKMFCHTEMAELVPVYTNLVVRNCALGIPADRRRDLAAVVNSQPQNAELNMDNFSAARMGRNSAESTRLTQQGD